MRRDVNLACVAALGFLLGACRPTFTCENELIRAEQSPAGTFVAKLFERDCGATTTWSYHLSLSSDAELLDSETGNIVISKGGTPVAPGLDFQWQPSGALTVYYSPGTELFGKVERIGTVVVSYVQR